MTVQEAQLGRNGVLQTGGPQTPTASGGPGNKDGQALPQVPAFVGLRWGLNTCSSNEFPGNAAGVGTTLESLG